ncbi:phosphatidylglycerophosphatase A [Rufibacter glacialis]|uniref:Phosphatidylglycerophosphatase A n=1 Tax=Rufibacter glacialis TaxID=1259555 RepID=A0A5M8QJ85_9BACT|nr:phosphatidylglycerophosphatase A [Rufibacter glacialis]KAA6434816.1 phosphatidylglycerophosphatase A [Rufibacter glacialis]GGK72663.1 phosphatidylglycerophosphatase A [Rufibacter glacialis]
MIQLHKLISSSLGIGYLGKGGGTVAAMVTCLGWYLWPRDGQDLVFWQVAVTFLITALGIWSANAVEPHWGKDDKKIVIDEVAGMCISLLFVPVTLPNVLGALVLFRFFDIVKPLFIKKMEKLPGGWGVMLDDVLSGVYANGLLQLLLYLGFF